MGSNGATSSSSPSENNIKDKFALSFINRRPDQKTVATMAPIGTDIRYANNNNFNEGFKSFFQSSYEPNFETSLDMGFAFTENHIDAQFAGTSSALKKLFMEPYRAGPLSLFCHRVGKTIYVDMDNIVPDETFKEKVQDFNENQGYVPYSSVPYPGLTLYENLIWNCKEASDVWKQHFGIYGSTELSLDFSKSALTPMFESYSYKIEPQNSLNGEAYIWEFHNTKMLVDSELPIFGGGNYPALTIRLTEGNGMPISVLTGVDMLLDQLMHHIKETIVVHHAEGKVKKYDVVVQKEIPYLQGSEFDPVKLQSITENMYSFLSSNMTQQGHTYWLCREQYSDELRLYDLTAICPEQARNRHKNPFLMPVVNLMYKIACKLITETIECRSQKVTNVAWGLLTAADKLIENAHVPEFRACINYLLAGLYLNHDPDQKAKGRNPKVNHEDLLKGLSEEMFKGYDKFPGIIKVDELIDPPEQETSKKKSSGSQYRIPNCKLRMDSATTALDYCKEALTCLERCRHDDEEIPYVADNLDDMAAYRELEHATEDEVFNHLRHALLLRAATCYLILATQASIVNTGPKIYRYSQAGLQCCSSIMSSHPCKRHEIIGRCLMPSLCACFVRSIFCFCDTCTDEAYLALGYREQEIIKIASEHVNFLDKYNFSRCWTYKQSAINFAGWTNKLDFMVTKFMPLIQEDFSGKKKLQTPALVEAIFDRYDATTKIAQVVTEIGGMIIGGLKQRMRGKSEEELAELFEGTPEMSVDSAVHFYDKSIQLIDMCPETDNFARVRCIILINSIIAKKVSLLLAHARKAEFLEQKKIAEDIFTVYHRAFSYMPKDLRTVNGMDIHVRCLMEYSDILLNFVGEHAAELDKQFPGSRRAYYEACVRNYDIVLDNHRGVPINCLSQLISYKTHVLYLLLKIWAQELNLNEVDTEAKCPALTKKIRKSVSNYLEFFEKCLKHVESLSHMEILDSARKPQSHFCKDIVPCFTSPHLTGNEKVRILKLTARWAKALLDCAPLSGLEEMRAAKEYAIRATVEIRTIAVGMRPFVDKTSEKRLNKVNDCLKLVHPPTNDKALVNVFKNMIAEAIKVMS